MILKLEDQVCSLESAKRLKEFGVRQESLFYWFHSIKSQFQIFTKKEVSYVVELNNFKEEECQYFSAYTTSEIGFLLSGRGETKICRWDQGVPDLYEGSSPFDPNLFIYVKNETECMSKLLIHLLENGLLEVKKI